VYMRNLTFEISGGTTSDQEAGGEKGLPD
jgi:hypothetical protein